MGYEEVKMSAGFTRNRVNKFKTEDLDENYSMWKVINRNILKS